MPINVIVVDDSVTIRAILEELLRDDPKFKVVGIASGAEQARDLVQSKPHSVITLDLAMPGIDGFQLLDEFAKGNHAPVVVVSSQTKSGTTAENEALERGAFACFDKASILSNKDDFLKLLRRAGASRIAGLAA